ncbi:MAG: hypothetical protein PHO14_01115 [Kiritimatiellae bacterium]|jgi:hypothetical protein|nr:hypothetical protein [Kiritimatiellia bacterium]MDD4340815.1 hypothetical protein [Kiritimatiellia bacterium]MDY0148898.1 hypothetical protein [Kiritimatiellia bacterium]
MAKRNRKKGHDGNRFIFWGVPFMALLAALGMVYLNLSNTCERIGRTITQLEKKQHEQRQQLVNEEHNWGIASSIRNMEQLLARHGIDMTWPAQCHIIRLVERNGDQPAQYALRSDLIRRD